MMGVALGQWTLLLKMAFLMLLNGFTITGVKDVPIGQ
jgi:hypothetical protein